MNAPHEQPHQVDALVALGRILRDSGYWDAFRLHRNRYIDRHFLGDLIRNKDWFPLHTRALIDLFAAGLTVGASDLCMLPDGILDRLSEAGVLSVDGRGGVSSAYRIGVLENLLLMHEDYRDPQVSVYLGEDSEFYANMLDIPRGARCLDLCCGTGVQALVSLGRGAAHADAVDINPRAVALGRMNARLNGLADSLTVYQGDLFTPLPPPRRYDRITCNPPLLPIPPAVPYPVIGDGGIDGLKFVRAIVPALEKRLSDGGKCLLLGLSTANAVPVIEQLCEQQCGAPMHYTLYLLKKQSIESYAKAVIETVRTFYPGENPVRISSTLRQAYRALGVDGIVSYFLVIQLGESATRSGVCNLIECNRSRSYWFLGSY
jgi:methylase of polypeptide subunit release factors